MSYVAAKEWHDSIEAITEVVKDASTNDPMTRRERGYLFDVEDFLSRAKDSLMELMDEAYNEVEEYRQWGIREGWFEPLTDKDWKYADSLKVSADH